MLRRAGRLILGGAVAVALTGVANAACPTWTTRQNGTPADASQVMGDLNYILQCPAFSGNVGIDLGTASPLYPLDVSGAAYIRAGGSNSDRGRLYLGLSNGAPGSGSYIESGITGGVGSTTLYMGSWGGSYSLSSGGKYGAYPAVFINTRAAADGADYTQLVLYQAIQSSGGSPMAGIVLSANGNSPSYFNEGNVGIGTTSPSSKLYVNGTAGGTSAWTNNSDRRLKKNTRVIADALAMVDRMEGVRFNWREPSQRTVGKGLNLPIAEPQVGFIAQELEKVLPEAVSTSKDPQHIKSAAETKVVPVLVEAIKELKRANERLGDELSDRDRHLARNDRMLGELRSENAALKAGLHNQDTRLDVLETRLSLREANMELSRSTH